jgi:hypothetical protein
MSGSIMPAFAADMDQSISTNNIQIQTNQKSVLTLEEAIKSAISISDTLVLDERKISYQDKTNDITEKQDDFNNVSGNKKDYNDDSADISLAKLKQQRDFDGDLLIQKVTNKYNDIVTNQMKIQEAAKQLKIKNKKLYDAKFKNSLGMTTEIDLKAAELEIVNLQNIQKSSENALKDALYSFKVLTGKDVIQYNLEQDANFEPLKIDGSIDEYLDNAVDSYLKYTEQLVKLNKEYYDRDYEKDNKISIDDMSTDEKDATDAKAAIANKTDIIPQNTIAEYEANQKTLAKYNKVINNYTSILASRLTYFKTKLSNYQDETNLNENKKKFKDNLKTYYTNLLTSEDKINYYKKNILINNEKLSNTKFKYDLGMITESDYNTQVVSNDDLDLQLRSEIINYNTLKEGIQKPWIAFSSSK